MTYKNKEVQPEFFLSIQKKPRQTIFNSSIFGNNFPSSISISIDTLVVIAISALMINLTAFVVGIEHGKIMAKAIPKIQLEKTVTVERVTEQVLISDKKDKEEIVKEKDIREKPLNQKEEVVPEIPSDAYSIQLVTYSGQNNAYQELEKLKADGKNYFILKSGEYFIIYSGKYSSKTVAKEDLDYFKKRYKDCYVRYLKNT